MFWFTGIRSSQRRFESIVVVAMLCTFCTAVECYAQATTKPDAPPAKQALQGGMKASPSGTFDIHYRDADLRGVLQLLSTQGRRNIVATKEVVGTVTADLYGVTFKEALNAVLMANGFVYLEKDNFIYVYTPKQLETILMAGKALETEIVLLSYITAADAKTLATPLLSKDGSIVVTPPSAIGISSSATDAGGNSLATDDLLVVKDYRENIDKIQKLLKQLDLRPQQIIIEATILSANLVEGDALGVNFNALGGIDFETLGGTITTAGAPVVTTGGDIDAAVMRDEIGATMRTAGFDALGTDSLGMTVGILGNRIAMFITALESVTDTTVLANPKLLVLNKQKGEVLIVERQGYRTETTTETGVSEEIEFLETGTRLLVRPFVCKDGYVRMEIHPEESEGIIDDDNLPFETTTEVTSNVLVKDGHTIVIGGLFREETQNARNQVPVLGNIPYLGTLFRHTNDAIQRREIIILITPHIVQQHVAEAVSEQLRDDVERFRIGQRKGVQWWARDRLVQTSMRWAKQALAKGHKGFAMWHLDMVLSMNPKLDEAIHLKERLNGRANWADEPRISSAKYIIQRMMMHEMGKSVELVIPPRKPRSNADVDPRVRKAFGMEKRHEDPLPKIDLSPKKPKIRTKPKKQTKSEAQIKPKAKVTDKK